MTLHQIALKAAEAAVKDQEPIDTRTIEMIVEAVLKTTAYGIETAITRLKESCDEILIAHRTKGAEGYNGCDRFQCQWCEDVTADLETLSQFQVVQAHAAQLQEQKEEKAFARSDHPSPITPLTHATTTDADRDKAERAIQNLRKANENMAAFIKGSRNG